MAKYSKYTDKNGYTYYHFTKVVGYKMNANGKKVAVRRKLTGKTVKELEEKINNLQKKLDSGVESKEQFFGIMADGWIKTFFMKAGDLKESSKGLYYRAWKNYVETSDIYEMRLQDVTAKKLQDLYNRLSEQGVATSSITYVDRLMKRFYKYLLHENFVAKDITSTLSVPKRKEVNDEEDEIVTWTEEELKTILHGKEKAQEGFERIWLLVVLLANTGCRIGELLGIMYDDIDEEGLHIKRQVSTESRVVVDEEGKTAIKEFTDLSTLKTSSSKRVIPLPEAVRQEIVLHKNAQRLENMRKGNPGAELKYVFLTKNGTFYDKKVIKRSLQRYYKRIGVAAKSEHTYRHTFATKLAGLGTPIQVVSKLLGHTNINVTAKYYVGIEQEQKDTAIKGLTNYFSSL